MPALPLAIGQVSGQPLDARLSRRKEAGPVRRWRGGRPGPDTLRPAPPSGVEPVAAVGWHRDRHHGAAAQESGDRVGVWKVPVQGPDAGNVLGHHPVSVEDLRIPRQHRDRARTTLRSSANPAGRFCQWCTVSTAMPAANVASAKGNASATGADRARRDWTLVEHHGRRFHHDDLEIGRLVRTGPATALDTKRGPAGWRKVQNNLADPHFGDNLAQADELINQIGNKGQAYMTIPLVQLLFSKYPGHTEFWGLGHQNFDAIGSDIEQAVKAIHRRDRNGVNLQIDTYEKTLPPTLNAFSDKEKIIFPILEGLKNDNAMHSTNGGIDLGDVKIQSQNAGEIKTAFDDPSQLALLLKSDGLMPEIESVQLLTQPQVNMLLGI